MKAQTKKIIGGLALIEGATTLLFQKSHQFSPEHIAYKIFEILHKTQPTAKEMKQFYVIFDQEKHIISSIIYLDTLIAILSIVRGLHMLLKKHKFRYI